MPRGGPPVKVACRLCHDRRVKCDRSEGIACSNCRNARRDCEPIISRRGRRRKGPFLPAEGDPNRNLSGAIHNVPLEEELSATSTTVACSPHDEREEQPQEICFPAIGSNGKTSYVGDSANLNYLIQQFGKPFGGATDVRPLQERLQGAMVARLGNSTAEEIEKLRFSTHEQLEKQGAFDLPSHEASQALLDVYFHYSLPGLPILDKWKFLATLKEGSFSHLLLNAIYLSATIYCSDSVITQAGFGSRYAASFTFYQRAKSLYDAGYETDAIATIQATFLIGHWWSSLLEHKDPWYWLGISAGLAHALGMHRAKSYTRLGEGDRKLWRRLWWVIYAMDINLSMLLDHPPHVQGRLCNVLPLSNADFEQSGGSKEAETCEGSIEQANTFVINAVHLARTVDKFFAIKFDEASGRLQDTCLEKIALWASSLPPEYQSVSTNSSLWAILTQILYQEYRLLLYRSIPRFSVNVGPGTPIFETCTGLSHMFEILIANDQVFAAATSLIAPVLSVLSIHFVNIRRGDPGVRMLSEHRARFCMMILDKLQSRYPVVAAIYPIFESLLKRKSAAEQSVDVTKVSEDPSTRPSRHNGPGELVDELKIGRVDHPEGLFDPVLHESMSMAFPFSFSFNTFFDDTFLTPNSHSSLYCSDEMSSYERI